MIQQKEDWVPRCLADQIKSCPWRCKCNDQNIPVKILQLISPKLQRDYVCARVCACACVCVCVHVRACVLHVSAKIRNENSLKSNVTLLRDAAVCLQVPWPFSILSLWKRNKRKQQVTPMEWNWDQITGKDIAIPSVVKNQDQNPFEDRWQKKLPFNCWENVQRGRQDPCLNLYYPGLWTQNKTETYCINSSVTITCSP